VSLGDAANVVVDADGYANDMFPVSGVENLIFDARSCQAINSEMGGELNIGIIKFAPSSDADNYL
jgi:hypothetical protein